MIVAVQIPSGESRNHQTERNEKGEREEGKIGDRVPERDKEDYYKEAEE